MDRDRSRTPAMDRAGRDAHRRCRHSRSRIDGVVRRLHAALHRTRHHRGLPALAADREDRCTRRGADRCHERDATACRSRPRQLLMAADTLTWTLPHAVAGTMVLSLNAYVLLGGADFGGGVWDLLARGRNREAQRNLIAEAIGPIWEANHVWLILV